MTFPPIRAYSKADIRYLLRNPEINLHTRKCNRTGDQVIPMTRDTLKRELIKHLPELGIESEAQYDSIRIFSPSQVNFIFEKLM